MWCWYAAGLAAGYANWGVHKGWGWFVVAFVLTFAGLWVSES
jgi:hypothetical protein